MDKIVNVIEKRDNSVQRVIERNSRTLKRKLNKKRKINEKLLKKRSPLQKLFSYIFDTLLVIFLAFAGVLCFSTINSQFQGVPPTFAGFMNYKVQTTSMVASGFNRFDNFIARSVDTKSLNVGDIIVFYPHGKVDQDFRLNYQDSATVVEETSGQIRYKFDIKSLFGFQTDEIKEAAKSGIQPVVHHVYQILQTPDGKWWFKTKGSSNPNVDNWTISEDMVLGAYDKSSAAQVVSKLISAITSQYGVLILVAPIFLFAFIIIFECIRDVQLAFLELDCVEEKRKITDDICVRNDVGFNMDTKTKYKILAQASDDERTTYISLLWRDGQEPQAVKKYIHKKNLLYKYNRKMVELNRECEKMYKEGVSMDKIAQIYTYKKEVIMEEERLEAKRLRYLSKQINERKKQGKVSKKASH